MLPWHVVEAQWTSRHLNLHRFATMQAEYSVLVRGIEHELLPALEAYQIGLLPYFPLASGLLTGKYSRTTPPPPDTRFSAWKRLGERYTTDANWDAVEHLRAFCNARGKSMLQLAFNWLLAKPVVTSVIAGATKPEQVEQNVKAAGWKLSSEDLAEIDKMPRGYAPSL
jgi:aryl-alcohol dehydrogenase-like predicted oxidoreductase